MNEQFLRELQQNREINFRADVPAGTPLGVDEIEPGAKVNYSKRQSMVRAGSTALPDRMALYDIARHDVSMVPPTIAQARVARDGRRFTTVKPDNWHDSDPIPIDETCEICERDPESVERPKFYSLSALDLHYKLVHTLEYEGITADRREQERREESKQMRDLISAIAEREQPPARGRKAAE